jgi:glycosyltransferase involved in cell wall biosynthesis
MECFAEVHRQLPRARLYMVGDGQMRRETEHLAHELGLENVVTFMGRVPHETIPSWLAASDVAVMPYPKTSRTLWFSPLKMYEYMAAGKAVVATRAGQIADVIRNNETGVLVDPGDTLGFARAMVRLLQDEGERRRLGQNARLQAVEKHTWGQYAQQLESIYSTLLASKKTGNAGR